jgi:hypothetical protein
MRFARIALIASLLGLALAAACDAPAERPPAEPDTVATGRRPEPVPPRICHLDVDTVENGCLLAP